MKTLYVYTFHQYVYTFPQYLFTLHQFLYTLHQWGVPIFLEVVKLIKYN
jgi:hypothetical protein